MAAEWYKLFNKTEFEATGLGSRTLEVELEDRGTEIFLVTKGNTLAVTYLDVMLEVMFASKNPYLKGGYAVYLDDQNDVWFGFPT